jgi:hypothetical protein
MPRTIWPSVPIQGCYHAEEGCRPENLRKEAIHPITESFSKGRSGKGEPSASKGGEVMAPDDDDELETETDYDPETPPRWGYGV